MKSQIDILASLIHPRGGSTSGDVFMMLEIYLDESGIHNGARICVVCGYYGHQTAWRKFEKQWRKVLSDYPEVSEGFHAKRFFRKVEGNRVSPYKNWSDAKANHFLNRLVQCVMRNDIFPVGYGIVVQDFLSRPLESRKWLTGAKFRPSDGKALTSGCPDKGYYVPFQWCILEPCKLYKETSVEKVHSYAGIDRTLGGYASSLYKNLLDDPRLPASWKRLLGGISFPLAKDTPGIQAADLFSYQLYHDMHDFIDGAGKKPFLGSALLQNLAKRKLEGQVFFLFNKDAFDGIEKLGKQEHARALREGTLENYFDSLRKS